MTKKTERLRVRIHLKICPLILLPKLNKKMKIINKILFFCIAGLLFCILSSASILWGQDKPKGPPPANVSVATVNTGMMAPQSEFIGTIYYQEVSDVASEVSGLVEVVRFEEGQRINHQQILVKLSSDILEKRIHATRATHEQVLAELQEASIDFHRKEKLFKNQSISEQAYDENRFKVKRLEKRSESLEAEVERLELELKKTDIRSPFSGVVVARHVDRGEWLSTGDPVAKIAKDDVIDIIIDLPERFIGQVRQGIAVRVTAGGKELRGKVIAIIPKGDIATRTIPVKIRLPNSASLIEGMTAKVNLPTGNKQKILIVPRDAIITQFGQTVVFTVIESHARMIPVNVIGYEGLTVGVVARDLKNGMMIVVKGNERLRNGQKVLLDKQG
jgi:membrane fusion protein (multidrug efflux system)